MKNCPECGFPVLIAVRQCPECGFAYPLPTSKLKTRASALSVLSKAQWFDILKQTITDYRNPISGKYMIRCTYKIGDDLGDTLDIMDNVPFNSDNDWAKKRCADWWTQRGGSFPIPGNPRQAIDRFKEGELTNLPVMVQVGTSKCGKYLNAKKFKFKSEYERKK